MPNKGLPNLKYGCPSAPYRLLPVDDHSDLVGMTVEDATTSLAPLGKTLRVTKKDGIGLVVTMDLRFKRVNVEVEGGVVTKFTGNG